MRRSFGVLFVISVILLYGCGRYQEYNLKPDDELSRDINSVLGEDFYYLGKEVSKSGEISYKYQIMRLEPEAVKDLVCVVNEHIYNKKSDPIQIIVYTEVPGGRGQMFQIKNHSNDANVLDYSGGMYWLYIREMDISISKEACQPVLYTQIEGIEELCIDKTVQEKAEAEGIDWYSCWPTLKKMTVIE